MSFALLLLAAAGILALGHQALALLRVPMQNSAQRWGLAIALGLAAALTLLCLPLALTGKVHFWPLSAACAASAIAALARFVLHRPARPAPVPILAWALVALAMAGFARQSAFSSYDERAIYGLKAKALLCERSVQGDLFQEPTSVHFHRDYALGLPLLMAWTADLVHGAPDDPQGRESASAQEWVRRYGSIETYSMLAALWALGLLLLAWGFLAELGLEPRWRLALAPLCLPLALIVPWIGGRSWSWAGADIPLALLAGAAAMSLRAGFANRRPAWNVPCALLIAAGILLKQDAVLLLIAASAGLLVARGGIRVAALAVVCSGLAWALVAIVQRQIPAPLLADRYARALLERDPRLYLERLPLLAERVVSVLSTQQMLAFWLAAALLGVPLGWRRGGWERMLTVWVAAHVALTLAVFLVTPHNLDWHVSTALPRVLCHAGLPAGFLLAGAAVELVRRALSLHPAQALAARGGSQ